MGAVGAAGTPAQTQAGFESFERIAETYGIELIETADINDQDSRAALKNLEPDICICPAWHQIIEPAVLDIPTHGFIGFHSSALPRGRGGAPINWSIIHGEPEITISMFRYTPGVDAGDVLTRESVSVQERDDVSTVIDRLSLAACDALSTVKQELQGGVVNATPQSIEKATYRPRRQPQDGIINWESQATSVRDWIRAQTDPYPGAYTFFEREKVTIWSAEIPERDRVSNTGEPGTVVDTVPGEGINVAVADALLQITRVQPDDGPRMWADNFASRYDIEEGDTFGQSHAPRSWLYTGIRDRSGGTDFSDCTSLSVGESTQVQAVILTQGKQEIQVNARLDERELLCETRMVRNEKYIPVEYRIDNTGTHTLAVEFRRDGERIDVRYLKIFVSQ